MEISPNAKRRTPDWVVRWLTKGCGVHIWLDACASAQTAQCSNFLTEEDNGLEYDWALTDKIMREGYGSWKRWYYVWVNPPYQRGHVDLWLKKAKHEWECNQLQSIVLLKSDMSTQWANSLWRPAAPGSSIEEPAFQMIFFEGRLHFDGLETGANFPSMIIVVGKPLPRPMPMVSRVNAVQLREKWTL